METGRLWLGLLLCVGVLVLGFGIVLGSFIVCGLPERSPNIPMSVKLTALAGSLAVLGFLRLMDRRVRA